MMPASEEPMTDERLEPGVLLTPDLLSVLAGFDCGTEPWAQEVNDYIHGDQADVLGDLATGAEVFLYRADSGRLVGFGALSGSEWRYPDSRRSRREPLTVLLMYGIHKDYQRRPLGPVDEHYSRRILRDLIARAGFHSERLPLLGLFVQVDNRKAIRAYEDEKFEKFSDPRRDPQTGFLYQRMLLKLHHRPGGGGGAGTSP